MNAATAEKQKLDGIVRTVQPIKADSNGELPTRIMLMQAGAWPNSVKGELVISTEDLQQTVENFNKGIARPGNGTLGLPIDFSHDEWDQAAAWINGLVVEGNTLYADPVEWSTAGKEAVNGGMFKCISPTFYPACRGGWFDPENLESVVQNVICGAGLTNIPFFAKLSPIKASAGNNNVIYISEDDDKNKENKMSLDQLRVKAAADLTDDEKKFVVDHKSELSADELKKFGLEEQHVNADKLSDDERKLLADIRSGKSRVVSADQLAKIDKIDELEKTAADYKESEAKKIVEAHVKRGAIKSDRLESWSKRLAASTGDERKELENELAALPNNQIVASTELGKQGDDVDARGATADLQKKAEDLVKADRESKTPRGLTFSQAQDEVLREDKDLADRVKTEYGKLN